MLIQVSGKNMDTGGAFQEHAEASLNAVVEKYFQNAVSGHITLERADAGFTVKTRVALSRRMELEATGKAQDAHAALDAAIEHAEKRLRRHKRRLKNHRNTLSKGEENEVLAVPMTVYASTEQLADKGLGDTQIDADDDASVDEPLPILADLSYDIEILTVEQAVMRLEFSGDDMLMFRNASHLGLNVVQRRGDGAIGWIDPRGTRRLNA